MPKKSHSVEVKPEVFKWLRESSGWTQEEIAKRIKTTPEIIQNIETGDKKPTIRQLKELSNVFKRPVAAFFLDEPIIEKPKPKDYRMLPNKMNIINNFLISFSSKYRLHRKTANIMPK